MTPEQQRAIAMASARKRQAEGGSPLSPQQQNAKEHPVARTFGRAGRSALAGLGSLADIGLLVPKTAALGVGLGAEKMGAEGFGGWLQRLGATPSMADTSRQIVDNATGGVLQPTGKIDQAGDFIGEMIAASVPFSKAPQALNAIAPSPPTAGTALKSVLDPETALNQLPNVQGMSTPAKFTTTDQAKVAGDAYKKAQEYGGLLKQEATNTWLDDIYKKVMPQTSAGKIAAGKDTAVSSVMQRLEGLRDSPLSLDEVQEIDEILGDAIDGEFGIKGLTKQGKKILDIQNSFRDMVENADESMFAGTKEGFDYLKRGRQEWSKLMKMKDIERIISRAEMSEQPANAIKSGFKTLYNNPSRMRGFTKEEQAFIKKAANEGVALELLRGVASRLFGIGSAVAGGPTGYAIGKGAEMGARSLRENAMMGRADNLINLISGQAARNDTPLLTNQGALAAIAGTQSGGQQMLPRPSLRITVQPNSQRGY